MDETNKVHAPLEEPVREGDIFIPKSSLFPLIVVLSVHTEYVYIWTPSNSRGGRTKVQWLVPEYKKLECWLLNHYRV